ncbi:aspartate dehydrogenase [Candidatus Woesearchaeota archaeon]|jgi:aspartate dehydrogenase|nr:aspartate dehydrogenase [Candidatus Woesearchaeota archaeon]|tara:strand:+ start:2283 stop:3068 length:786 start_codon:yes stop_codon:yes gene_type:complete
MKVGIVGCGTIGKELALFIDKSKNFNLKYVYDIDDKATDGIINKLKDKPKFSSLNELIKNSELIIEAAGKSAVKEILKNANLDKNNKKILIMSTAGIIENSDIIKKLQKCNIYLPSGAISGLDSLKAVSGEITSLTLTTTKPINGLNNAPYIIKNKINLDKIKNKKMIFDGNLKQAIKEFPENINVAATIFLASKFNKINIKIIVNPNAETNTHNILCKGPFGIINTITENMPSNNPKTSYLAILSAISALKGLNNKIIVG